MRVFQSQANWCLLISAADKQWRSVLAPAFQLEYGRNPTDEELENLSDRQRNTLLRRNPQIPARVFNRKLEVFLQMVRNKDGLSPFGTWFVEDHFARIEFQVISLLLRSCLFGLLCVLERDRI